MLNDRDYELISKPIIELYNEIEQELLVNIAKRFKANDDIGGTLEWQLKKLHDLGALNGENVRTIAKYSGRSEKVIREAIETAGLDNIDTSTLNEAYNEEIIAKNPKNIYKSTAILNVINESFKDVKTAFKLIQTKALESSKQEYMSVLNTAYLEVSSGIYDYGTSIRKSLAKMADRGIIGATYERSDGTIVNYSIEGAVRRDILTAVNQTANKVSMKTVDELDAEYIEVSAHLGARPSHAEWQGKVYKVHGHDDKYDNLVEKTGYGTVEGLGGVNCRHHMYPFFPGISERIKNSIDPKENDRIYELTRQQRSIERDIRKYKKRLAVAEASGDDDMAKDAKIGIKEKQLELRKFLATNSELKRDYLREKIAKGNINPNDYVVGNIDISKYTDKYKATTKDVVILPRQIEHINSKHPGVYKKYKNEISNMLDNPDIIFEDPKRIDTLLLIKKYDNNVEAVLKLNTNNANNYKNSIISMWEISDKRLQRYMKTHSKIFDNYNKK
jgi:hypothetical protein